MDFSTAHSTKIPVRIDGVDYHLPQFLNSAFKERVASENKRFIDQALEQIGPKKEERARFLLYFRPPAPDVAEIADNLKTPAGIEHVIRWCAEHASPPVPGETLTALLDNTPALFLRDLAGILMGTETAATAIKENTQEPAAAKDGETPLPQGGESNVSPPPTSDAASTITTPT